MRGIAKYRPTSVGVGSVAGAIALLMVLSPLASATVVIAPFHGQVDIYKSLTTSGCAAKATFTHKPTFSLSTGKFLAAGTVSAKTCSGVLGQTANSQGVASGQALVALPITVGAGTHSVAATYGMTFSSSGAITPGHGNCPTTKYSYVNPSNGSYSYNITSGVCLVEAFSEALIYGEIYDSTNNSYCPGSWCTAAGGVYGLYGGYNFSYAENYTDIYWGCYGPGYGGYCFSYNYTYSSPTTSWSSSGSTTNTVYLNGTFAAHHRYTLLVFPIMYVYTYMQLLPGSSGKASLDMGHTLGNDAVLQSITLS